MSNDQEFSSYESSLENKRNYRTSNARDEALSLLNNEVTEMDIVITETASEASTVKCDAVLNGLAKIKNCSSGVILLAISHLLQQGGTSKKVNAEVSINIGSVRLNNGEMQRECAKQKISPRQLARGLKNDIADIFLKIGDKFPVGNQCKQLKMDNFEDLSVEEMQWASDFQTFNDRCPTRIREWLVESYKSRFNKGIS